MLGKLFYNLGKPINGLRHQIGPSTLILWNKYVCTVRHRARSLLVFLLWFQKYRLNIKSFNTSDVNLTNSCTYQFHCVKKMPFILLFQKLSTLCYHIEYVVLFVMSRVLVACGPRRKGHSCPNYIHSAPAAFPREAPPRASRYIHTRCLRRKVTLATSPLTTVHQGEHIM